MTKTVARHRECDKMRIGQVGVVRSTHSGRWHIVREDGWPRVRRRQRVGVGQ